MNEVSLYKKVIYYGLVMVAMVVLLYLMIVSHNQFQTAQEKLEAPKTLMTATTIYGILFGILIESRRLLKLFWQGIQVNWLIVVVGILLIVLLIPRVYWLLWYGSEMPFFVNIFFLPQTHMLMAALSGILLVRSLGKFEY